MRNRRRVRESCMRLLYSLEKNPTDNINQAISELLGQEIEQSEIYVRELIGCVINKKTELDLHISKASVNWDIDRLNLVEKVILRIAISEILFLEDIPAAVAINEAVDIAKKYCSPESAKFINGILDHINKNHNDKSV